MRNESQDVEGFSVTGTNSTQRVAEQHVTPPTGGMRRTASISATHFVLRECVSSTEEVSMRHVCVLCHPYTTQKAVLGMAAGVLCFSELFYPATVSM